MTEMPARAKPLTPEQVEGADADARTDIFPLGALLYEMATGRRAFQGSSRTSLIAAIVSSQPPDSLNVITNWFGGMKAIAK